MPWMAARQYVFAPSGGVAGLKVQYAFMSFHVPDHIEDRLLHYISWYLSVFVRNFLRGELFRSISQRFLNAAIVKVLIFVLTTVSSSKRLARETRSKSNHQRPIVIHSTNLLSTMEIYRAHLGTHSGWFFMCVLFLQVTSLRKTVQNRKGLQSWNSNMSKAWFGGLQPGEAVGGVRVGEYGWDHVTCQCGSWPHRGRWIITRNIRLRSAISEVLNLHQSILIFSSGIALRLAKPLWTSLGVWRYSPASLEDPPAEPHVARGNAESGSPSLQSAKEHHDGNLTT